MEDNFSKFRLTTGIAAMEMDLPIIAIPVKKSVSKHASILNNSWTLASS